MIYLIVLISSFIGTLLMIRILSGFKVFDEPNDRSNHVAPVPRGGGIAVILPILGAMIYSGSNLYIITGIILLGGVSLVDDVRTLSAKSRFIIQILSVILGSYAIDGLVFQGIFPKWLDMIAVSIIWLWFINLYNFMDGIDGITGMETITIVLGIVFVAILGELPENFISLSVIIGSAVLGFLIFNWYPAKIFIGDVGSIPLGFLLGWLLLDMAGHGYWAAAIIIPLYYLADSTITLLKRLLQKKKIWEAHSEHFYQRSVRSGKTHDDVVKRIGKVNLLLVVLAVITSIDDRTILFGIILASIVVIYLLFKCCRVRS